MEQIQEVKQKEIYLKDVEKLLDNNSDKLSKSDSNFLNKIIYQNRDFCRIDDVLNTSEIKKIFQLTAIYNQTKQNKRG